MVINTVTDNFDINVFNRAQYENPGGPDNEWMLCPYKLTWDGDNYSISDEMQELNLVLTLEEARALTLGVAESDGGDFCNEDDFWIDANSFKQQAKSLPDTVRTWLDFVTYNL